MVLLITKHRFISNILTLRFTITFFLCLILFVASTLILQHDYTERLEQYRASVQESEEALQETYTFAELNVGLNRPPSPLSIICEGADKRFGTSVNVAFDKAPTIAEERGTRNPLLAVFQSLDLTTVIEIVLSLLVIFLAYNTISGEREQETLKLVLSNTIPRYTILIGNFLGGMISVVIPLCIGLIISLMILINNPMIEFTGNDYLRILMIFFLGILYLSAFYLLALFLSSRIRHSATVLILLLFVWIVLIIILPNTAVYASQQLVKIPDRAVIDSEAQTLLDEWSERMQQYAEEHPGPWKRWKEEQILSRTYKSFFRERRVYTGGWPYAYRFFYAPKEVMEWIHNGSIFGHNLRMEYEDRIWQLYQGYQLKLNRQVRFPRFLSLLSPSRIFYYGSSVIAGTSENEYLHFLEQAAIYRKNLITYMKNKGGLDSYLLFTRKPVDSFLNIRELIAIKDSKGEEEIENIMNYSINPLDLSDLPKLNYSITNLRISITHIIPEIMILLFLNILLFLMAWISFQRADVR